MTHLKPEELLQLDMCYNSPATFIHRYCQIYSNVHADWIPFHLYPFQLDIVRGLEAHNLNILLKSRQVGASWMGLAYGLWLMLFRPQAHVLVFSRRETDARYLIGKERMRGIYTRLPAFMKSGTGLVKDSATQFSLENGSTCFGMSTKAGDGFTVSYVLVDEASIIPDLDALLVAVKPTIDAGGKMFMVSRANKTQPNSSFNNLYKSAEIGATEWNPIFVPWYGVPGRTQEWYDRLSIEIEMRTGSLDDLYQNYPSTAEEALKPATANRRLPYTLLSENYIERPPMPEGHSGIAIQGLQVYQPALAGSKYVIGVDVAEGGTGDYTSADVLDKHSGEQVAHLREKTEAMSFGDKLITLSYSYNFAPILIERNSVGAALIQYMKLQSKCVLLHGLDGKIGFHTNVKSKPRLYATLAEDLWDKNVLMHNPVSFHELASIEADTLRAPKNSHDDAAMSFVIANHARHIQAKKRTTSIVSHSFI